MNRGIKKYDNYIGMRGNNWGIVLFILVENR